MKKTDFVIEDNVLIEYASDESVVEIPDTVSEIGIGAFYECESIRNIIIPSSVVKINKWAFRWCSTLENIIIPESVTEIGKSAFYWCYSLKEIYVPKGLDLSQTDVTKNCKIIRY